MNPLSTMDIREHSESSARVQMEDVTAVLLVGGLGTRLRPLVPSTPKPLASVGRKSFLQLLVRQLRHQGIRRVVMCTGYLGDQIEREFGNGDAWDVVIEYSKEAYPLGTAGAVKLAEKYLHEGADFLVMNGDSFLEVDLRQVFRFHRQHRGVATMAVLRVENATRYGRVHVNADGRVVSFAEKSDSRAPGLVNAGVYVFNRAVFECMPEGPSSLERDVFPQLLSHGVYALEQHGTFIDIGTPEDYMRAQRICDGLYKAALDSQYSDCRHDKSS
jgi:NDP-sugar pyrophosphorylase family protein